MTFKDLKLLGKLVMHPVKLLNSFSNVKFFNNFPLNVFNLPFNLSKKLKILQKIDFYCIFELWHSFILRQIEINWKKLLPFYGVLEFRFITFGVEMIPGRRKIDVRPQNTLNRGFFATIFANWWAKCQNWALKIHGKNA